MVTALVVDFDEADVTEAELEADVDDEDFAADDVVPVVAAAEEVTPRMADTAAGAAKTAVKPTSAVTLAAPVITLARCAGWGRRRPAGWARRVAAAPLVVSPVAVLRSSM